jgi:cytochrome P450 family 26 subfamily A
MGMINKLWFSMFRKGRQILSSFFSPIGLQSFVPRMHETTRAHFEQFWEKKDEIKVGMLLKKITLSLAIDLFMSVKESPESHALAHDMDTYLAGYFALPLDFFGTTYHKARLAREKMLHTLDITIRQKQKASDSILQIFLLSCINLSLFPKKLITFTIRCLE